MLKALAGIAGVVFLLAPLSDAGIVVSVIAIVVALLAAGLGSRLSHDEDDGKGGYWPKDPRSSG